MFFWKEENMNTALTEAKDIRGKILKVGDLVAYKARVGLETGVISEIYKNKAGKKCVLINRDSYKNVKIAEKSVIKIFDNI